MDGRKIHLKSSLRKKNTFECEGGKRGIALIMQSAAVIFFALLVMNVGEEGWGGRGLRIGMTHLFMLLR